MKFYFFYKIYANHNASLAERNLFRDRREHLRNNFLSFEMKISKLIFSIFNL